MHYGIFLGNRLGDKEAIILDLVCFTQIYDRLKISCNIVHLPILFNLIYVGAICPAGFMLLMEGKGIL